MERERAIVHLDADAFFASVEQAADSRLRGQPVAVGGEKRGVIASASYEARRFGVETAMPTVRARKLCPKLIVLPGDFEKYERFSDWMFSYAYDFTPEVEISSIDEGYFDLSGQRRKSPSDIAQTIGKAIYDSLKITVSEGLASNKLISQIASKLNKPDNFLAIPPGYEQRFLQPLPNHWLPGVGPRTASRLNAAGLALVGQIALTPPDLLSLLVGGAAQQMKQFAHGIDDRPVVPVQEAAKSYGQQETFAQDQTSEEFIQATLRRMADELMAKVRSDHKSIRTLAVKVRYNDMEEEQCSESLLEPTDLETDLYGRLHALLRRAWSRRVSLRLVSLKLSNLYSGFCPVELQLDPNSRQHEARRRLATVVDDLRRTHGANVILRGHDFVLRQPPAPISREAESPGPRRSATAPVVTLKKPGLSRAKPAVYVPLAVHSYYSFLDSTLSISAIVQQAKEQGIPALALSDRNNLHGAVEFMQAAQAAGVQPIVGAEVILHGQSLRLYVENATGYHNLCQLLTELAVPQETKVLPAARAARQSRLLATHAEGLVAVSAHLPFAREFPERFYQAVGHPDQLRQQSLRYPGLALPVVRYARADDRWKYDVVQSIRTRTLLRQEHPEKQLQGEAHFPTPQELGQLFGQHPELIGHTRELAERCRFVVPLGQPQFPNFQPPDGSTPAAFLRHLVLKGLQGRYGDRAAGMRAQVEEELGIIGDVGYDCYFLVVWELLQECRGRGIEWITRGSAADSLVCYCLGISGVCPVRFDLYFRRFLNRERMKLNKLPDIDIDFPHDRKDEVIDLIFARYGHSHTAVVGGFSTYQARSALGDVAKVLGVSERQIRRVTEQLPHYLAALHMGEEAAQSIECHDLPLNEEPYKTALQMAAFLDEFPRHPKMHPCGVVLSREPIATLTPCFVAHKGYPTTHYDMHAVESLGLVKMDILAQGGLAVMRDAQQALARRGITVDFGAMEPWQDPLVWEMIAGGGSRAVHHIESPAMIGLCRMCQVRDIDTLIAIVSVIRPGAANENKKSEFTRRYQELSPVVYPHPSLEPCLRSTFGLVVYEEHILQMCELFAGLCPGRADVLRRALGKDKEETIAEIRLEFQASARALGRTEEEMEKVWGLINGFRGYTFCKAHSTAYGVEAYQSAWLKRYYPAETMAAVLTNGKGFYQPLVYVLESLRLGLSLLAPWVNEPGPGFQVVAGDPPRIRVPVSYVKGLTDRTREAVLRQRAREPFGSMADFYRRVQPTGEEMEALLQVGAFDCFGKNRTTQYWDFQFLYQGTVSAGGQGWLFPPADAARLPSVPLREPDQRQRLLWESELLGFPVSAHPLALYDDIAWETYCPVNRLGEYIGEEIVTCGLIIEDRLYHQVTGEAMKFITIADWTGIIETELFAKTYRSYGLATVRYPILEVVARVEPFDNNRGYTLHVMRAGKPRGRQREVRDER